VEYAGLTTTEPEKSFHEMMDVIENSLSELGCSDDREDGDDQDDEEATQGKPSNGNELHWVKGTLSKMIQQSSRSWRRT